MLVCFGPHLAWQLLGAVGLASLVVACIATKRHWDRIGWYELRPIALPKLPFRVRCYFESATFGSDGAQFSKWPRRRFIAYSEIRRVETLCVGSTLEGVLIHFSAHPYHRTDNAPELLREGSMRGESSRRALAVLRQWRLTRFSWGRSGLRKAGCRARGLRGCIQVAAAAPNLPRLPTSHRPPRRRQIRL